jgi:hypothetical protein
LASRGIGQGLGKIEPSSPNMLIAYSAKAGSTALDGDAKNSPFTLALAKHLTTPGLDVRRAFGFVRDEVLKTTGNKQEPFVYGSLGGDDVPLVPAAKAAPSTPAPNPQAEARRDYELALQIGNKDALSAFLAQYPDGFYANLAKIQIAKIAAEETRVAATEKARLAEQERARLAAEGTQKTQQLKAAEADAKAAEQARIAAEKAKQVAQEQAAAAEQKRAAAEIADKLSEKITALNAAGDRGSASPPPAENAQDVKKDDKRGEKAVNVASLTAGPPPADLTKSVQIELRRVGCLTADADGEWNTASQRSMALFNRHARTKFDVKVASVDALDAIKLKPARVCPMICEHGFEADGDRCSKIVCGEGSFLNGDNECEKRRGKATVKRNENDRSSRRVRPERQDSVDRGTARYEAGYGARPQAQQARPLTGSERFWGCNSNEAIMSGKCP